MARYRINVRGYRVGLADLGDKIERPLGHNTRLVTTLHGVGIRYHRTVVVDHLPDGTAVLDSGEWRTSTTKDRMNAHIPERFRVYQQNHDWYVWDRDRDETHDFRDGIRLSRSEGVLPPAPNWRNVMAPRLSV